MKNNPNSYYDQINSKFNKRIGKLKAHARLTQKHTIKQESNENQFLIFLEKLKNENDKLHLIDGYIFELLSGFKLWLPRDATQAMDAWFGSFQIQIQESPLLTFQELKNQKKKKYG